MNDDDEDAYNDSYEPPYKKKQKQNKKNSYQPSMSNYNNQKKRSKQNQRQNQYKDPDAQQQQRESNQQFDPDDKPMDIGQNNFNEQLSESQYQPVRLRRCSKGCGRKFKVESLAKHEKICVKVFQKKRKIYNTADKRMEGDAAKHATETHIVKDFRKEREVKVKKNRNQRNQRRGKQGKKEMWKKQSLGLRAAMKAARGVKLTKAEDQAFNAPESDDRIQCPHCGRKFNETAGKRHIKFCAEKHKYDKYKPQQKKTRSKYSRKY